MNTVYRLTLLAASVALAASSCSTHTTASPPEDDVKVGSSEYRLPNSAAVRSFFGGLHASQSAASDIRFERNLADYLPNQPIRVSGNPDFRKSSAVVVGTIVDVVAGRAYDVPGEGPLADAAESRVLPFGSDDAQWKVARVIVDVEQSFGLAEDESRIAVSGFLTGDDYASQIRGLEALGRTVIVLDLSRGYSWDESLYYVARGGSLLGDVDDEGHIGFPALGEESATFVDQLRSVADVSDEAKLQKPALIVSIDKESGVLTREVDTTE
jgi:hypothetical protein